MISSILYEEFRQNISTTFPTWEVTEVSGDIPFNFRGYLSYEARHNDTPIWGFQAVKPLENGAYQRAIGVITRQDATDGAWDKAMLIEL